MKKAEKQLYRESLLSTLRDLVRKQSGIIFLREEPIVLRIEDIRYEIRSIASSRSRNEEVSLFLEGGEILYAKLLPTKTLEALVAALADRDLEETKEYAYRVSLDITLYERTSIEAQHRAERIVSKLLEGEEISNVTIDAKI